jgi:hypothetical protein
MRACLEKADKFVRGRQINLDLRDILHQVGYVEIISQRSGSKMRQQGIGHILQLLVHNLGVLYVKLMVKLCHSVNVS